MGADSGIPLKCGDPGQEPASFTLFVFPFAYSPVILQSIGLAKPCYRPIWPGELSSSVRYFTHETADALFNRAAWMRMSGEWQAQYDFTLGSRKVRAKLAPPTLALLEWKHYLARRKRGLKGSPEHSHRDPLGTGFLILELSFPEQKIAPSLDDLIQINEGFRFYRCPYPAHESKYRSLLQGWPVDLTDPDGALISAAELNPHGMVLDSRPEFYFQRWLCLLKVPVLESEALHLFPPNWGEEAQKYLKSEEFVDLASPGCMVYADNRAFTWTCALIQGGGNSLRTRFTDPLAKALGLEQDQAVLQEPEDFGHWIRLLNVDEPGATPLATHQDVSRFERAWARSRTYKRWQELGTWYGFSSHSGALLAAPVETPPLWRHFRGIYFHQCLLLLYVRVSIFRLSARLHRNTEAIRDGFRRCEAWAEFEDLLWLFSVFTNFYQFPLISNQQQGLEMYSALRQAMDIDELFGEVEKEIRGTHDFLLQQQAFRQGLATTRLTVVATVGLLLATAFGFLGINVLVEKWGKVWSGWGVLVLALGGATLLFILTLWKVEAFADRLRRLAERGNSRRSRRRYR